MKPSLKARHQHALECYSTTEQRARGLRQWIQMVIDEIINKDLQSITWKVSRAAHQLRVERIRLMKVNPEVSVKQLMFFVQIIVGEEENTEMDLTFFSEENVEGANSTEYNGGPCEGEGEVRKMIIRIKRERIKQQSRLMLARSCPQRRIFLVLRLQL